jgi:RimJ/RimL family protein N-acetyltransferase
MRLPYRDLRTDRLLLRSPREGDAPLIFESFGSDREVVRYLTWIPHETVADAEAALDARLERLAQETEYSWILELSTSRRLVGLISAWFESNSVEVGFVLARPYWNQGLTTEALLAVTHWALASPGVAHVWATCDIENKASARVLEKAGFVNCGEFHRAIIRPNISPVPRPSLLFSVRRLAA